MPARAFPVSPPPHGGARRWHQGLLVGGELSPRIPETVESMSVHWNELFALSVSPLEMIVRGSLIYWFLFLVFRTILRRDVGAIGVADVLLLVLIADAAQNAMAGEYRSVTDGIILVSTIIGWNLFLDWLSYLSPTIRRLVQPAELCLVRDGHIQHRNLRREFMSEADLNAKLREHGVASVAEVRRAYMESDGTVTVLKRKPPTDDDAPAGALKRSLK